MSAERTEIVRDRLAADFRAVIADAEDLIEATAGQAGEKAAAARARIQKSMTAARQKISAAETVAAEQAKAAAHAADDYVHQHPWTAVGLAAGVGAAIGLLISRH